MVKLQPAFASMLYAWPFYSKAAPVAGTVSNEMIASSSMKLYTRTEWQREEVQRQHVCAPRLQVVIKPVSLQAVAVAIATQTSPETCRTRTASRPSWPS